MSLQKLGQKLLLTAVILVLPGNIYAEGPIKADGPKQVEKGDLVRISIDGLKGLNDPKLDCFPKNDAWEAVQRLNGDPVILFFPKKEGLYTFVIAGNKDSKTYFELVQVQVGKNNPDPIPGPKPTPEIGKYTSRLKALYMVSPDNASLTKLIAVYTAMASRANTIQNYKQMADALSAATKATVGELALRAVRDDVSLILQSDLANRNSQTYDPVLTEAVFVELVKSLTPLLDQK